MSESHWVVRYAWLKHAERGIKTIHGRPPYTEEQAKQYAEDLNRQYIGMMRHWAEPQDGAPSKPDW